MEKHRKAYMDYFELSREDFAPCEVTGGKGSDVHHIFGRVECEAWKRYGITQEDDIENLMFLSRDVHQWAGQNENFNEWLMENHLRFLEDGIPAFERNPYSKESQALLKLVLEKSRT